MVLSAKGRAAATRVKTRLASRQKPRVVSKKSFVGTRVGSVRVDPGVPTSAERKKEIAVLEKVSVQKSLEKAKRTGAVREVDGRLVPTSKSGASVLSKVSSVEKRFGERVVPERVDTKKVDLLLKLEDFKRGEGEVFTRGVDRVVEPSGATVKISRVSPAILDEAVKDFLKNKNLRAVTIKGQTISKGDVADRLAFEEKLLKEKEQFRGELRAAVKPSVKKIVKARSQAAKEKLLIKLQGIDVSETNEVIAKRLGLSAVERKFLKATGKWRPNSKFGRFVKSVTQELASEVLTKPIDNVALLLGGAAIGKSVKVSNKFIRFVARSNPALAGGLRLGGRVGGATLMGAYAKGVFVQAQLELASKGSISRTTAKALKEVSLLGVGSRLGSGRKIPVSVKKSVSSRLKALAQDGRALRGVLKSVLEPFAIRGKKGALRGVKARKSPVRSARKIKLSKGELRKRTIAFKQDKLTVQQRKEEKFLLTKKSRGKRLKELQVPKPSELEIPSGKFKFFEKGGKQFLSKGNVILQVQKLPKGGRSVKELKAFKKLKESKQLKKVASERFVRDTGTGQLVVLKKPVSKVQLSKVDSLTAQRVKVGRLATGQELALKKRVGVVSGEEFVVDRSNVLRSKQVSGLRGQPTGGRERVKSALVKKLKDRVSVRKRELAVVERKIKNLDSQFRKGQNKVLKSRILRANKRLADIRSSSLKFSSALALGSDVSLAQSQALDSAIVSVQSEVSKVSNIFDSVSKVDVGSLQEFKSSKLVKKLPSRVVKPVVKPVVKVEAIKFFPKGFVSKPKLVSEKKPKSVLPRLPRVSRVRGSRLPGFFVQVKRKGKWVNVASNRLGRNNAELFGKFLVDNSVAASFRVKKSNLKVNTSVKDLQSLKSKFRRSRAKRGSKGVLVEKRKHRIDSFGELKGLKISKLVKRVGLKSSRLPLSKTNQRFTRQKASRKPSVSFKQFKVSELRL